MLIKLLALKHTGEKFGRDKLYGLRVIVEGEYKLTTKKWDKAVIYLFKIGSQLQFLPTKTVNLSFPNIRESRVFESGWLTRLKSLARHARFSLARFPRRASEVIYIHRHTHARVNGTLRRRFRLLYSGRVNQAYVLGEIIGS